VARIKALFSVLLLISAGCSGWRGQSQEDIKALRDRLESDKAPQFTSPDSRGPKLWEWTREVYASRQFRPVWSTAGRVDANADELIRMLENASAEGLNPDDLGVRQLHDMRGAIVSSKAPSSIADLDLHLTYSLVRYASELCFGRVDPQDVTPDWHNKRTDCDVAGVVSESIDKNDFPKLADAVGPRLPEYKALRSMLHRYRDIAAQGGWKPLPDEARLPGGMQQYAGLLKTNLVLMGDLKPTNGEAPPSDDALREALRRFESRHGLEAAGELNEKTVRAMNVPVQDRIEQIEINLDRLRWIGDMPSRHIRVNVPAFELAVHDGTEIPLQMRVIVGTNDKRTPIFSGEMQYIVFSPYWNIPENIAKTELLPKIRKDPEYLARQQIEVVRGKRAEPVDPSEIDWDAAPDRFQYQLRQKPGGANSLGLVKFMFPNPFDVYLHDTPADNLFGRMARNLSHGCVRLERPAELAEYVLKANTDWGMERIKTAMHSEEEKHVQLQQRIPVHIVYWTAWVDRTGVSQFRDDVYGYDAKHRSLVCQACSE
jgi:L,D-transpeptidase YcbB